MAVATAVGTAAIAWSIAATESRAKTARLRWLLKGWDAKPSRLGNGATVCVAVLQMTKEGRMEATSLI